MQINQQWRIQTVR
ncbi:Hypothetical protein LLA12_01978 [Lactococcus lactis subsp. lactis]|nr:Hypothetical protein LLA12_01978 [Lactococcus lactis subsp. lactis]